MSEPVADQPMNQDVTPQFERPALDIHAIMRRLPHRYPFLMIDRVLRYGGDEVVALKNVTLNEGFFSGHFPGEPIMPGVMIGECMAQSAAFLDDGETGTAYEPDKGPTLRAFLMSIDLKLKQPVVPGDQLWLNTRVVKRLGKVMRVSSSTLVEGCEVACAEFTVAFL